MNHSLAACASPEVNPEWFYPPEIGEGENSRNFGVSGLSERTIRAKAVCVRCPIRRECAEELGEDKWATVGGLTPAERFKLRRGAKLRATRSVPRQPLYLYERAYADLAHGIPLDAVLAEHGVSRDRLSDELQRAVAS